MARGVEAGWVPVEACTLPTAQQPLRLAEFDVLFTAALVEVSRPSAVELRLHLTDGAGVFERAQDLVARESECCSFFGFRVARIDGAVVVEVAVPAERVEVLDGLERQARVAR